MSVSPERSVMSRDKIEQARAQMYSNGYQPVPVYGLEAGGKKPMGAQWQNKTELPAWCPDAPNTGINCRGLRAIDIDVDELDAAGIRALVETRLGPAPVRVRSNSGRSLLLYRAAQGEPRKRMCPLDYKPPPAPGEKPPRVDKVEVLGKGQQFVAHGIHETGVLLEWSGSSPFDTPRDKLTAVTEEQIEALLDEIFERFATPAAKAKEAARTTSERVMPINDNCSLSDAGLDRAWAKARLQGEMQELAQTGEGGRNDRLNRAVFNCAQCVPLNLLTEGEIVAAAEEACRMNGLAMDRESGGMSGVQKTIASAMKEGKANPYPLEQVEARRWTRHSEQATRGASPSSEDVRLSGSQTLLNSHALKNLPDWYPQLFKTVIPLDGGGLEGTDDDKVVITATANGISGGILPIDLVAEQLGMSRDEAADQLAQWLEFELEPDQNAALRARSKAKQERKAKMRKVYEDAKGDRATIPYHAHAFTLAAEQSEKAILARNKDVLVRGGALVRPVVCPAEGAHGKPTKAVELKKITLSIMKSLMDSAAVYMKPGSGDGPEWVPTFAPTEVAALILDRVGYWSFPEVVGAIACPTLRPDGSLLSAEGYDPATRLYLVGGVDLPPLPEKPTKADAEASLARLNALLDDFPFVDEGSRSVALSALISPVLRGVLPRAPIHAVTAPTAGTGKSFLLDLGSIIATGFPCAVQSVGPDDAETEKRLVGSILAGRPIICLDNINAVFGSDFLCQIATQARVEVRPLGGSDKIDVEPRMTIFANGNNMVLTGDLTRRAIVARLDAAVEDPHKRQFKGDPAGDIMRDRGQYVADAITIVRAYIAAGRPGKLPKLASFDVWSDNVRSALVWLGCADPCDTMERVRDDDPERAKAVAFFEAWKKELGTDGEYKVKDLIQAATSTLEDHDCPLLREAITAIAWRRGQMDAQALGIWLDRYRDRVISDLQLTHGQKIGGSRRWLMRQVERGA